MDTEALRELLLDSGFSEGDADGWIAWAQREAVKPGAPSVEALIRQLIKQSS